MNIKNLYCKINNKFGDLYNRLTKLHVFLLSIGIVLFCYFFASEFGAMTYHTNDDVAWQNMVSHFTFDGLWWHPPFPSILFTYPIGILYCLIPQVSWWYVVSQLLVFSGMLATHYVALRLGQIKNVPFMFVIALLGIFDAVFNVICIAEIAWTIVPVVTGSGVISMTFYYLYASNRAQKLIPCYIFIGTLASLAHRRETGIIVVAFLILSIAYILTEKYGFFSKKMLAYTLCIAIFFGLCIIGVTSLNSTVNVVAQGEKWKSYSAARSAFMDYAHDSYEDNPELYEAVGWSEDTASFAKGWIFFSDEITEESLRYISENSISNPQNKSIVDNLWTAGKKINSNILMKNTFFTTIIVIGLGIVWLLCCKQKTPLLFAVGNGLVVAVLLAYLMLIVCRVIFRSLFIVLYPGVLVSILLILSSYKKPPNMRGRVIFGTCVLVIVLLISVLFTDVVSKLYSHKLTYKSAEADQLTVEQYLSEHSDNMYIVQGFSKISYKCYSPEPEDNSSGMGGSMWLSNWQKIRIEDKELGDSLDWSDFELPHVYFIGYLNNSTLKYLDYLQREYNCKGIAVIEPISNGSRISCYCMKFVYDSNEEDFDSYYSAVNGEYVLVTP